MRLRTRAASALAAALLVAARAGAADPAPAGAPAPVHEDARVAPVPWTLPPPGSCAPASGLAALSRTDDAPAAVAFRPGDSFDFAELGALRDFLPGFVWESRERFFHPGMRLEIGRCFADYGPPDFYLQATAEHAGEAKLTEAGGIENYTAGLPFPADRIAPDDPRAGLAWAWNFELRYQGAGFRGDFRTSDMVGRDARAEPFVGEIFKHQVAFRADRPGYQAPGAKDAHWVAGGLLKEPFDARHHSWRQYRHVEHLADAGRTDDLHAYLPDFRRTRRIPANDVEGLYMPSFSVGLMKPQVVAGLGGGAESGGGGSAGGSAGQSGMITTKRSGFEGLELRPLLYHLEVKGVQDVLTPINAATPAFPTEAERDFGPWGLSFASDRWDLRRALVLEGRAKGERGGDQVSRFELWVDLQTLAPLYFASWDSRNEAIDAGMFVGRWSEERDGYPRWPDDAKRAVRVIDPVGAAFAHLSQGGGWRRESWEIVSTPPPDGELRKVLSVKELTKRR